MPTKSSLAGGRVHVAGMAEQFLTRSKLLCYIAIGSLASDCPGTVFNDKLGTASLHAPAVPAMPKSVYGYVWSVSGRQQVILCLLTGVVVALTAVFYVEGDRRRRIYYWSRCRRGRPVLPPPSRLTR